MTNLEKITRDTAAKIATEQMRIISANVTHTLLATRAWLSSQECAQYIGFSEQHLSTMVRDGTAPPSVLISARARRFARADVDQWIRNGGKS